ncbi:hypothetical protein [Nocardia heshunensis]
MTVYGRSADQAFDHLLPTVHRHQPPR